MDICSFVFLSLGPVGPRGGGIYSIIEDVVCQASGVSKSSKNGVFYKSSYLRFEFFISMQN